MTSQTRLNRLTEEYNTVYAQEEVLEKQRVALATEIKELMAAMGESSIENTVGIFTVYPSVTWKYSPKVTRATSILNDMKKVERTKGTAKAETTQALRFTPKAK